MINKLLLAVIFTFTQSLCYAQSPFNESSFSQDKYKSRISEYFFSPAGTEVLQPVKLIGRASKPGLYHLPNKTNLTTLLTISGGMDKDADSSEIVVTNSNGKTVTTNLKELIQGGKDIALQTGDIVYIPEKDHMFDQPTVSAITSITSIVSLILTVIVVSNNN